jgi:predicted amidohydrolase
MRLTLAQLDFTVGALEQNVTQIGAATSPTTAADADFVVISEMP